jgi:hypothetical protein
MTMHRLTTASVCCEPPAVLDLEALSPRVRQMVKVLLEYEAIICDTHRGCVELHYHQASVQVKLKMPLHK